jgi:probable HAF family extracellular repeat protein
MNMTTKLHRGVVVMAVGLAALIAALSANAAQNYTATPLGTLGGKASFGYGINNTGQVTGWSWTAGDLVAHPFFYTGGVMTDLGSLGGDVVHGEAVNNLGQVPAGTYTVNFLLNVHPHT